MHRDEYDGAARFARRRPVRPDEREWYPPDDVGPYSFPHRPRIHEVQRPDDRTPRGYGRTPRSARSLDAFHHNMPQQQPAYLTRVSTDVQRRPRKYPVYEEDDEPDDVWHQHPRIRASTSEFEPPQQPRRPRQRLRAAPVPVPEPEPEPPSSDSPPSDSETESDETESESESESESEDEHIEVVEEHSDDDDEDDEDDDEDEIESHHPHRHHHSRQHRHASRDVYMNSSQDQKQLQRNRRRGPPTLSDEEIEVEEYEPTIPDVASPRQILARRQHSESPKYDHQSRVASVIETSRPPVATRRLVSGELSLPPPAPRSDHRIRTIKIYDARDAHHREGRPRRSPSAHSSRQQSRSSSRRAPSLLGSNFGESSSRQSSPERPARIRDCNMCLSEVPTSKCPKLKCGHRMCQSCLTQRFKSSLNEPQNFPPKCCKSVIDPVLVENLLDRSFKKQWNRKYAEISEAEVKSRHPVYCTSKRCGAWIKPHHIHHDRVAGKKIAQCGHCDTKVCVNCNTKWHYPKRCPSDQERPKYLEQAQEEGWKRCYKCKNMVELKEGRSHIVCRCGARFCVLCGIKWRKCDCPLFSYEGESDHPSHTVQSTPKSRRAIELDPEHSSPQSPGERRAGRALPPARAQPKSYEEEMMLRQLGEQREGKVSRKLQYISEGDFDPMGGPGDLVAVAKGPKHYMHDPFVHEAGAPAPPLGAADARHGYERGPGGEYVTRSKRGRGKSIDQRLADRFAETRQAPGPMPGMEPPAAVMGHHMGPPMMPPPPMGMPPPVAENGYPPNGRVIVEQELEYEDDGGSYFSHSSRSRARSRRRARRSAGGGEPKSSLLAGLSGRGTGMGRVDVWRKYVQPGDFEGEIASAAVAATAASA